MNPETLFIHDMKNQLGIIVGYCELLLDSIPSADERHADVLEIQKAAKVALTLMLTLQEQER